MENNKVALMSGKLSGTKSLKGILEEISEKDEIEKFIETFVNLKLEFQVDKNVVYINDDQDFLEYVETIEKSQYLSIYINEAFTRFYITIDSGKTFVIRINKVSSTLLTKFISHEQPIKFSLNSFSFIKWCVGQNIDMRNIYDIPTYIKILTNEVDPFKSIPEYIQEYSNYQLTNEDEEFNQLLISNFIYQFGKFLCDFTIKFDLDSVCKLINENSYYEIMLNDVKESCTIRFAYSNLLQAIKGIVGEKIDEFKDRAYMISPLGRVAIKYGHSEEELVEELYLEDIDITILNELYNNNIKVKLDENNVFVVSCKYKNMNNVFALITATLNDIFYTIFNQTFEAEIKCEVKE